MADKKIKKGFLAWMADNHVAANLLMAAVLIGGFLSLYSIKQEVFPEFTLDVVNISVSYPGATPEEVEEGVILAIAIKEEVLKYLSPEDQTGLHYM